MNNSESAKEKKISSAEKIVKEMIQRKGSGQADRKILDHYKNERR